MAVSVVSQVSWCYEWAPAMRSAALPQAHLTMRNTWPHSPSPWRTHTHTHTRTHVRKYEEELWRITSRLPDVVKLMNYFFLRFFLMQTANIKHWCEFYKDVEMMTCMRWCFELTLYLLRCGKNAFIYISKVIDKEASWVYDWISKHRKLTK